MSVSGIDISNNNPTVDLPMIQRFGKQFMIHKATEGTGFRDALIPTRWVQAQQIGLDRVAYHFARPDVSAPEDEARYFLDYLSVLGIEPGDGVALDMEMSPAGLIHPLAKLRDIQMQWVIRSELHVGMNPFSHVSGPAAAVPVGATDLSTWTLSWLGIVEKALGFKPFFYSGMWFMQPHGLIGNSQLGQYGLWLGGWGPIMPATPPGWNFIAIWQNSGSATVPGVSGPCDTDIFNGTSEQLKAYGAPVAQLPPPKTFDSDAFETVCRQLLTTPPSIHSTIALLQEYL